MHGCSDLSDGLLEWQAIGVPPVLQKGLGHAPDRQGESLMALAKRIASLCVKR
jgi:hypothetical protein